MRALTYLQGGAEALNDFFSGMGSVHNCDEIGGLLFCEPENYFFEINSSKARIFPFSSANRHKDLFVHFFALDIYTV